MGLAAKILLTLGLLLPVGGFVVGSLVSSAADEPAPRDPIVITEPSPSPTPTSTPAPTAGDTPSASPTDDHGGDDDVEVIVPEPGDVDDDSGPGNADDRGERDDRGEDDDRDDGDDDD